MQELVLPQQLQRQTLQQSVIVCADLDETLTYHGQSVTESYHGLVESLQFQNLPLIAVTGREVERVTSDATLSLKEQVPFAAIAAEVGTSLYLRDANQRYNFDTQFEQHLLNTTHFEHEAVYGACVQLEQHLLQTNSELQLRFQPRDQINAVTYAPQSFKISFTFVGDMREANYVQEMFYDHLFMVGFEKLNVVISGHHMLSDNTMEFYLDVLAGSKQQVVSYLTEQYHCTAIVVGDSGNDAGMLLDSPHPAILVANQQPELSDALARFVKVHPVLMTTPHFQIVQANGQAKMIYNEIEQDLVGPQTMQQAIPAMVALLNPDQLGNVPAELLDEVKMILEKKIA